MFISSSQDILYLVIAFCVVWVTAFLCWMFYYVMRLLRNTNEIVEDVGEKVRLLTDGIEYIRGKVEQMNMLMATVSEGVMGLLKKMVTTKAKQWVDAGMGQADKAAKEAVDKAVEAAAEKMKKTARKIRREDQEEEV